MSSAEADTLRASAMCSETVHTAAVLSGTRSFLTDITAHRLRLPCRRDAPTSYQIKTIRRDHPTNASQYQAYATSCLSCKGDRLAKRFAAVGRSRLRDVGTLRARPFRSGCPLKSLNHVLRFSHARIAYTHDTGLCDTVKTA